MGPKYITTRNLPTYVGRLIFIVLGLWSTGAGVDCLTRDSQQSFARLRDMSSVSG